MDNHPFYNTQNFPLLIAVGSLNDKWDIYGNSKDKLAAIAKTAGASSSHYGDGYHIIGLLTQGFWRYRLTLDGLRLLARAKLYAIDRFQLPLMEAAQAFLATRPACRCNCQNLPVTIEWGQQCRLVFGHGEFNPVAGWEFPCELCARWHEQLTGSPVNTYYPHTELDISSSG